MNNAILYEGSFVQTILDDAQLIEADATRSNFSEASLQRVQGLSAELLRSNLCHANLSESNFYDADFQKTNLEGANLSHVNLRWASLRDACLAHAVLTGAQVEGTTFIGVTGLQTVEVEWIDIGSEDAPRRLEGKQAKDWLKKAATQSDAQKNIA